MVEVKSHTCGSIAQINFTNSYAARQFKLSEMLHTAHGVCLQRERRKNEGLLICWISVRRRIKKIANRVRHQFKLMYVVNIYCR